MPDRAWGELVRERRAELGLRQDELAALAGVGVRTVHVIEAGKPTVRLDVLAAVVDVLGLELTLSSPRSAVSLLDRRPPDDER